jgi:hypothetical protein
MIQTNVFKITKLSSSAPIVGIRENGRRFRRELAMIYTENWKGSNNLLKKYD